MKWLQIQNGNSPNRPSFIATASHSIFLYSSTNMLILKHLKKSRLLRLCFFLWIGEHPSHLNLCNLKPSTNSFPLLHQLYLINKHSFQEHASYGTSCLLLGFLSPTTGHRSYLRSIDLTWFLSPLSISLSSFFLLTWLGLAKATMAFPQHNSLRKATQPCKTILPLTLANC